MTPGKDVACACFRLSIPLAPIDRTLTNVCNARKKKKKKTKTHTAKGEKKEDPTFIHPSP